VHKNILQIAAFAAKINLSRIGSLVFSLLP
jgi:hypothetical protein